MSSGDWEPRHVSKGAAMNEQCVCVIGLEGCGSCIGVFTVQYLCRCVICITLRTN